VILVTGFYFLLSTYLALSLGKASRSGEPKISSSSNFQRNEHNVEIGNHVTTKREKRIIEKKIYGSSQLIKFSNLGWEHRSGAEGGLYRKPNSVRQENINLPKENPS